MLGNPFILKGYEKFWQALLSGGMVTATTTLAMWALSSLTPTIPIPDQSAIIVAVAGVIQTFYTAFSVLVTGNTPTEQNTQLPPENTMVLPQKVEQPKSVTIDNDGKTITENPVF